MTTADEAPNHGESAVQKSVREHGDLLPHHALFVGGLGAALPVILLVGGFLDECCIRPSISAYYYSPSPILRGLLVGTLVAIAVFLICYKGHPRTQGTFLGDS